MTQMLARLSLKKKKWSWLANYLFDTLSTFSFLNVAISADALNGSLQIEIYSHLPQMHNLHMIRQIFEDWSASLGQR